MVVPLESFKKRFKILKEDSFRGDLSIEVGRESVHALLRSLKEDPQTDFNFLMDLTAADYPQRESRFEVVYHLYSLTQNHRIRVKVALSANDPVIDTVSKLWTTANWYEREVFDMFGIRFIGHPDLRRILMPESFEGHPLRKDYPATRRQKIPVPLERP